MGHENEPFKYIKGCARTPSDIHPKAMANRRRTEGRKSFFEYAITFPVELRECKITRIQKLMEAIC